MTASVVCAVDDSPVAARVLRTAGRMSESLGLRLVVAHAVPVPAAPVPVTGRFPTGNYALPDPAHMEANREAGEYLLKSVAARSPEAEGAELRTLVGDPAESLLSLADEEAAALLVVGSRGRGPLKAALLGSVSSALATHAPCPVLIVPPDASRLP